MHEAEKSRSLHQLDMLKISAQVGLSCSENIPILKEFREKKIIVSLTSYPQRDIHLETVLYSLLMQSTLPDKILLWLSYEEYPNGLDDVTYKIKKFQKYGIEIHFCNNIKSYKKLIPSLKLYPNDVIVTADDDIYYPQNWLKYLYSSYLKYPDCIHAHRVHKVMLQEDGVLQPYSKFVSCIDHNEGKSCFHNFATGCGGILYPPCSLFEDVMEEKLFMHLAPSSDDVWFWVQSVLQGTKVHVVDFCINNVIDLNKFDNVPTLFDTNFTQNDVHLKNILEYYPDIKDKLVIKFNRCNIEN